jgi:hypothetical protein
MALRISTLVVAMMGRRVAPHRTGTGGATGRRKERLHAEVVVYVANNDQWTEEKHHAIRLEGWGNTTRWRKEMLIEMGVMWMGNCLQHGWNRSRENINSVPFVSAMVL